MAVRTDLSSSGEIGGISLQEGVRNYLSTKRDPFPFQRSNLGSSGQTYLPLDPSFRVVIKWQNAIQTEAEHLCSEFYSRVFPHLSVPKTELICTPEVEGIARQFLPAPPKKSRPDAIRFAPAVRRCSCRANSPTLRPADWR